jgi:hypothetical protein
MGTMRGLGRLAVGVIVAVLIACGSESKTSSGDATSTLRSAARATADAHSFTTSITGAEATYEAPDRAMQVEHGQAESASASIGGSPSSSGPFESTITKVFIGDQYYEGDDISGEAPTFTVSSRCPNESNMAESVVRLLRAIATDGDAESSGSDTYMFRLPEPTQSGLPASGTATVADGFVRSVTLAGTAMGYNVAIDAINTAPSVTAPTSATPSNVTCG